MKLLDSLLAGELPQPGELLDALQRELPLIGEFESTPQDPEWHGEGNVRVHTEWVLREALAIAEAEQLDPEQRAILLLGAALHDIGKPLTTKEEEIDGRMRITSAYHAPRGRSHVAPILADLGLPPVIFHQVLGLIGHHHAPKKLVRRKARGNKFARLSRAVDAQLVYWMEMADLRGRDCPDREEQIEWIELFRLECEEAGTWNADPYISWRTRIAEELDPQSKAARYVLAEGILDHESGIIASVEEALGRTYEHRESHPEVTILCGPSGAGKSSWIAANGEGWTVISRDNLREKLTGRRDDHSMEGQVTQAAKEQLRIVLRAKGRALIDATNLRRDGRAQLVQLARDYHAFTRLVVVTATLEQARSRNRDRRHPIPSSVLEKQFRSWEWPEVWEAHRVELA